MHGRLLRAVAAVGALVRSSYHADNQAHGVLEAAD